MGALSSLTPVLADEYGTLFGSAVPTPTRLAELDATWAAIFKNQARYEAVANKLPNPPWFIVGLLHYREADFDFTTHLFNGDPLSRPTVHEPKGQPPGSGPFTWEQSAWAALRYDGMDRLIYTAVAQIAFAVERYNGPGYRNLKVPIESPYLWAGSNHYQSGKFGSDGRYSAVLVDQQLGVMTLLKHAVNRGRFVLRGQQILPAPVTPTGSVISPE